VFNVHEALKILKKHYVTDNIQMVSRFIREGRLVGERGTRKDGWKINESDLYDFIDEEKPGIIEIVYIYDKYSESVFIPTSEEYLSKKKRINITTNEQLDEHSPIPNKDTSEVLDTGITKEVDGINHKVAKKKKVKYEKMTYEKFCEILEQNDVITQDELVTLKKELKLVYFVYYDQTTTLRDEILCDKGSYTCPILPDQKTQKTFLPLLKNTAPKLLEKAIKQVLYYSMDGKVKVKEGYSEEQVKMNIPVNQETEAPHSAITDQNINEKDDVEKVK
jgi:hypothetical protein